MIVEPQTARKCPACNSTLSRSRGIEGLCPGCLIELGLESASLLVELEGPDGEATLAFSKEAFSPGQILGRRYRVRALLGRGGMGEVWHATDLKLRVDVALKALRPELLTKQRALDTLRQEVRTSREVVSPNVCRVFDLVELDGQELVSMEYIDGVTLLEILRMRAPLELTEAREIASQFLAGLEAIHEAGLVHRDVKPENLMMTRSGRVVLMDFGIAKGLAEGKVGTLSGTPAYMAPEHARGEALDARADVFAAGVVLAEMIAPEGLRTFEARQRVWEGIHHEPRKIADSPWSPVLKQAVAPQKGERHDSAAALARALEEVTLRVAGAEDLSPYPGLASFTESDAEYFFGRELEVEAMWKKLRRPHLLGLIGPSGAGKSSFLRAGLLPVIPTGWRAAILTPGGRPFSALARALVPQLTEDTEALQLLTSPDDADALLAAVTRWRQRYDEALLIVDQFEELFTQNPPPVQARFSDLLGRLALEADVHVLLSMREDFLGFCSQEESLAPIFSELTPLKPLSGGTVRRALVQPALKCGYRFEDDSVVDEMVTEVSDERGALPLLAFAAYRLWDQRDREQGLLTREAYELIGGVGGALAQHAEATLERIGTDRVSIARELFRNLVTAQGTRAARDREELLSVFGDDGARASRVGKGLGASRTGAAEILDILVDARLLTSYEVSVTEEGEAHQRIEIIHESLLTAWPRLVRWQTQDTEGAQLRDELRQAAQMWEQHSRSEDLLWTGTAFQEFQLWRERYPGGLTGLEEAFGEAMTRHAERRRRRRRMALAATFAVLLSVLAVIGGLWRRSVTEARRAEAAKLLAIAQLRFETDPTEALAYAVASLELADTEETRVFAREVLWEVPPALELIPGAPQNRSPVFSPDGTRLAVAGHSEEVRVWTPESPDAPVVLPGHLVSPQATNVALWASNQLLVTGHRTESHRRVWSLPEGRLIREIELGGQAPWARGGWQVEGGRLNAAVTETDAGTGHEIVHLRSWRLPNGEPEELGRVDWSALGSSSSVFGRERSGWIYSKANEIFHRPLPMDEGVADRLVGRHDNEAQLHHFLPRDRGGVWTRDAVTSELRLWDLSSSDLEPLRVIGPPEGLEEGADFWPDSSVRWAVDSLFPMRRIRLWDLEAWPESRPITLRRSGSWYGAAARFHPGGEWLVASTQSTSRLTFWPLRRPWPRVVDGYTGFFRPLAFSPDGKWLATVWGGTRAHDQIRLWPLPGNASADVRALALPQPWIWSNLVFDPLLRFLFLVGNQDRAYIVPLDGSPPRRLEGFSDDTFLGAAAVSPSGQRVATAFGGRQGPKTLRVWDLETGKLRLYDLPESSSVDKIGKARGVWFVAFADESTLYTAGDGGVRRWDLESGAHELMFATRPHFGAEMSLASDGRTALVREVPLVPGGDAGPLELLDLATGQAQTLPACGEGSRSMDSRQAIDASGSVVACSDGEGVIRVGQVSGGEPHLLVGHKGPVDYLAVSPDGRWVASTGEDNTLRLWPIPDLDQAPLHSLPREELIAKLESLTNIRVVPDPDSAEGWKVTLDPFPGWQEVPTW